MNTDSIHSLRNSETEIRLSIRMATKVVKRE